MVRCKSYFLIFPTHAPHHLAPAAPMRTRELADEDGSQAQSFRNVESARRIPPWSQNFRLAADCIYNIRQCAQRGIDTIQLAPTVISENRHRGGSFIHRTLCIIGNQHALHHNRTHMLFANPFQITPGWGPLACDSAAPTSTNVIGPLRESRCSANGGAPPSEKKKAASRDARAGIPDVGQLGEKNRSSSSFIPLR